MELFQASNQWANRPSDERFSSLQAMRDACRAYYETAQQKTVMASDLRVEVDGVGGESSDLVVTRGTGNVARVTNWAFGQLCSRAGAPRGYLEKLPPTLAAQNLNHGLKNMEGRRERVNLLFHNGQGLLLRAMTSDVYERIWNWEVCDRLLDVADRGSWAPPPAYRRDTGKVERGDSGLYASDHDMFAFLVDEDHRIDDGTDQGLGRGFFCWNSEVGARSFGIMTFLYRYVCGNHIVWGAQNVVELKIRHVGRAARGRAFNRMRYKLREYAESSSRGTEQAIRELQSSEIAGTKDEVLDAVFGKRSVGLTRKQIEASYELAEKHPEDGNPRTRWGLAQGVTRLAGEEIHADRRNELDRAAGKLMEATF